MKEQKFSGILELNSKGAGTTRHISREFSPASDDVHFPAAIVRRYGLREGCLISGIAVPQNNRLEVARIDSICGFAAEAFHDVPELTSQTAVAPDNRIILETKDTTSRVLDLIVPMGRGQRALIVAPPRSGKTILLQKIAESIKRNYNDLEILFLLVDERPEEVTEMSKAVDAKVFASSNDRDFDSHARIARLTLEYAKRHVETGQDVVILLDSLTRLGRAFNAGTKGSGRIMSGGIDVRALEIPKRIFGASRNIEHGGSLTIIATILVDTGSRMDELIFQEFKGTGNSEIVLDRALADLRIFPSINVQLSGTRREELLLKEETEKHFNLRRSLLNGSNREALSYLLGLINKTRNNRELLHRFSEPVERTCR